MLAVIKTGGKQYKVSPKDKLKIEKLAAEEGAEVVFDNVLLVSNEKDLTIGEPLIKGAKVTAKVLKQAKADKVMTFKYKSKKRYKVKKGHRQLYTEVEILDIKN
jgi:large subunit ribosomal protein L21